MTTQSINEKNTNTPVVVIIESLSDYHAMKDDLVTTRSLIKSLSEEKFQLIREYGTRETTRKEDCDTSDSLAELMKKINLLITRERATTVSMAAYLSSARKKVLVASSILAIAVTAGVVLLVRR